MRKTNSKNDSLGYFGVLLIIFLIGSGVSIYRTLSKWYVYKQANLVGLEIYIELTLNILMFVSVILLACYKKIGFFGVVIFSIFNILMNILGQMEIKYIVGNIIFLILLVVLTFKNWNKIR